MRILLLMAMIFTMNICLGAVYMHFDAYGNPVYSDTPEDKNAKIVPVSKSGNGESTVSTSISPTSISIPVQVVEQDKSDEASYTEFRIISPIDNEAIQNADAVHVKLAIKPDLQKGDKVQLLLDNKLAGTAEATTTPSLSWIDRGTHTLSAVILDNNQKVIKTSNSITIYVHRVTLNSPTRTN